MEFEDVGVSRSYIVQCRNLSLWFRDLIGFNLIFFANTRVSWSISSSFYLKKSLIKYLDTFQKTEEFFWTLAVVHSTSRGFACREHRPWSRIGFFLATRKRAFSCSLYRPARTSVPRVIGARLSLALIESQLRLSSGRLRVTVDSISRTGKHVRGRNYRACLLSLAGDSQRDGNHQDERS